MFASVGQKGPPQVINTITISLETRNISELTCLCRAQTIPKTHRLPQPRSAHSAAIWLKIWTFTLLFKKADLGDMHRRL